MATSSIYPIRLDSELLKRAGKLAETEKRTIASIIRQALDQFLQEKGQ